MEANQTRRSGAPSLNGLEAALRNSGELGVATADYIRQNGVRIGFHVQSAGARWTIDRRIELHPRYSQSLALSAYPLSLVAHEVRHLQQGPVMALSVYGELDAWQIQFGFLSQASVEIPGSELDRAAVRELLNLRLGWDRTMLAEARRLMRVYGGKGYRADLLPLYPMHREIAYQLIRRVPPGT